MDYSLLVGIHNCGINDGADCDMFCPSKSTTQKTEVKKERKSKKHKKSKSEKSNGHSHREREKKERKEPEKQKKQEVVEKYTTNTENESSCEVEKRGSEKTDDSTKHTRTKSMQQTSFPLPPKFLE